MEDSDANVIIIALHCCSGVFCKSLPTLYIADQPRPLATGEYAAANSRCWSSYVNELDDRKFYSLDHAPIPGQIFVTHADARSICGS